MIHKLRQMYVVNLRVIFSYTVNQSKTISRIIFKVVVIVKFNIPTVYDNLLVDNRIKFKKLFLF